MTMLDHRNPLKPSLNRTAVLTVCGILTLIVLHNFAAIAQKPQQERKMLEIAAATYQEGKFEKALEQLNVIIRRFPRSYSAYFLSGELKVLFLKDPDASIADSQLALKLAGNAAGRERIYNNLGLAYQVKGESDLALKNFDKAIALNPRYPTAYNGRGVILEKQGKIDDALAAFTKNIELDPIGPYGALSGRADIYFSRNEFDLALADLEKLLKAHPDISSAYIRRGFIRGVGNKWELAVNDFRTAFEIDRRPNRIFGGVLTVSFADVDRYISKFPTTARAYAARGFINYLRKRDSEAEADFKSAFNLETSLSDQLSDLIASVKERR